MNDLTRSRYSVYGKFATGTILKSPGVVNIKTTDPTRTETNMLNNYQHRPRPTIFTNNDNSTNEIALYSREPNSLMLQDYIGNKLLKKTFKNNKSKITTLNEDLLPNTGQKYNLEPFKLDNPNDNKNPYYPRLNLSQYNIIPKDIKPAMLDARMYQFTQEREFNLEDDKIQNAVNLNKDGRKWDKLNRQDEANRTLQGLGHAIDNIPDNYLGYVNRPAVEKHIIVEETLNKLADNELKNEIKDGLLRENIGKIQRDSLDIMNQYYNMSDMTLGPRNYNNSAYNRNIPRAYDDVRKDYDNQDNIKRINNNINKSVFSNVKSLFIQEKEPEITQEKTEFKTENFKQRNANMNLNNIKFEKYQITNKNRSLRNGEQKTHTFSQFRLE